MEEKPERPLVSIIMAARNAEKYISESIRSLQQQSYSHWEAIVVDDASTDSTFPLIQDIQDDRIYVISNPSQQGAHRSRNTAIAAAKGEYIAVLDSDDIAMPDRLELQLAYFHNHPEIDILGGGAIAFGSGPELEIIQPGENEFIQAYLLFKNAFVHSSVMFRRTFFERSGLLYSAEYNVGEEDYHLFFDAAARGFKMANLPSSIVWYRQSENQLSNSNPAMRAEALFRFFQARLQSRLGIQGDKQEGKLLFRFIMGRIDINPQAYLTIKKQLEQIQLANTQKKVYPEIYFNAVLYFFYIRLYKYYFMEKKKVLSFLWEMTRLISELSWKSFLIFLRNRPRLKTGSTNMSPWSRQG